MITVVRKTNHTKFQQHDGEHLADLILIELVSLHLKLFFWPRSMPVDKQHTTGCGLAGTIKRPLIFHSDSGFPLIASHFLFIASLQIPN